MECSKCGKQTEDRAFATYKHRDGRIGRRTVCKKCRASYQDDNFEKMKAYRKQYNIKNRTKKATEQSKRRQAVKLVIDKIKSETPCCDCGRKFHPVAMDFDHIKGKRKSIASMYSQAYKIDLILEEIERCEVVCACCHRIRTMERRENLSPKKTK